jgi:hypothetical protein
MHFLVDSLLKRVKKKYCEVKSQVEKNGTPSFHLGAQILERETTKDTVKIQ